MWGPQVSETETQWEEQRRSNGRWGGGVLDHTHHGEMWESFGRLVQSIIWTSYTYVMHTEFFSKRSFRKKCFTLIVSPDWMHWKRRDVTFVVFLPKMLDLNLMTKCQTNSDCRTLWKTTDLYSKNVDVIKYAESLGNDCRLKMTKKTCAKTLSNYLWIVKWQFWWLFIAFLF